MTKKDLPLQDKVALITGASRGIGRAAAEELALLGAKIIVNYVRHDDAAKEISEKIHEIGSSAYIFRANVGDPAAAGELVDAGIEHFGRIDILVHSAALGAFKPVHKLKLNQWDLSMDVNAKAFYVLAQKLAPGMEAAGGGNLIGISSLGSTQFIPDYGAIGISKAALETLVRYLAVEFAAKKIRVNCVSGGLVDTDALKSYPNYEAFKNEVIRRTPAGRIAEPHDLARVIAFLASPDSEWICGQTIVADGGLSLA